MRDSFVFYRSFYEAIRELDECDQADAYDAICNYALNGVESEVKGAAAAIFKMAKPQIDANNKRWENGRKGGRPKNETKEKPKQNQTKTKDKPNDNQNETNTEPNVNVNVNDINNIMSGKSRPYQQIIDYLNQKTGKRFRVSKEAKRCINARFDDGFTLDDFKKVIDNKCAAWKGDPKMDEYLRPITLFSTKFESYLQERSSPKVIKNRFNNFENSQKYDFAAIEAAALNR